MIFLLSNATPSLYLYPPPPISLSLSLSSSVSLSPYISFSLFLPPPFLSLPLSLCSSLRLSFLPPLSPTWATLKYNVFLLRIQSVSMALSVKHVTGRAPFFGPSRAVLRFLPLNVLLIFLMFASRIAQIHFIKYLYNLSREIGS